MLPDDLVSLRTRLRERIIVHQNTFPWIAKRCGVPARMLAEFMADGPLPEPQATYLFSFLHFENIEDEVRKKRIVNNHLPGFAHRFRLFRLELENRYGLRWKIDIREFENKSRPQQMIEIKHMEERLKAAFLERNQKFIAWHNLTFSDGHSYWQWMEKFNASQEEARRWRPGSEGPGPGNADTTPIRRSSRISWRG
jgi:hypothetical protein